MVLILFEPMFQHSNRYPTMTSHDPNFYMPSMTSAEISNSNKKSNLKEKKVIFTLMNKIKVRSMLYRTMGCSPSSSDITINESVISRERGSDLGTGLMTCRETKCQ